MSEKKKAPLSRRDFLFGGLRKLRGDDRPEAPALAAATQGVAPDRRPPGQGGLRARQQSYAGAGVCGGHPEYRECVRLFPAHLEARKRLGYCSTAPASSSRPARSSRRVIARPRPTTSAPIYLGLTFARMGRGEKAVAAWRQYRNTGRGAHHARTVPPDGPAGIARKADLGDVVAEVEETIRLRKEELLAAQADAQG